MCIFRPQDHFLLLVSLLLVCTPKSSTALSCRHSEPKQTANTCKWCFCCLNHSITARMCGIHFFVHTDQNLTVTVLLKCRVCARLTERKALWKLGIKPHEDVAGFLYKNHYFDIVFQCVWTLEIQTEMLLRTKPKRPIEACLLLRTRRDSTNVLTLLSRWRRTRSKKKTAKDRHLVTFRCNHYMLHDPLWWAHSWEINLISGQHCDWSGNAASGSMMIQGQ